MDRLNKIIKRVIKEATSDASGSRGGYIPPMQPGLRPFEKSSLEPFNQPVSDYKSPLVQYDSYDNDLSLRHNQIVKLERTAAKAQDYIKHHQNDGKNINRSIKYKKTPPFLQKVPFNEWVEVSDKGILNEDLAVWFGKKKKPKGSSQPKGPWVNICRKVDGKHPPCGRSDTSKGAYPKCRAAGVASKMSDSQKRSACQQKRTAEKKDTQTGKGQKPIMTSYKPKKK